MKNKKKTEGVINIDYIVILNLIFIYNFKGCIKYILFLCSLRMLKNIRKINRKYIIYKEIFEFGNDL